MIIIGKNNSYFLVPTVLKVKPWIFDYCKHTNAYVTIDLIDLQFRLLSITVDVCNSLLGNFRLIPFHKSSIWGRNINNPNN